MTLPQLNDLKRHPFFCNVYNPRASGGGIHPIDLPYLYHGLVGSLERDPRPLAKQVVPSFSIILATPLIPFFIQNESIDLTDDVKSSPEVLDRLLFTTVFIAFEMTPTRLQLTVFV